MVERSKSPTTWSHQLCSVYVPVRALGTLPRDGVSSPLSPRKVCRSMGEIPSTLISGQQKGRGPSSIWQMSFANTNSLIVSSTSLLVGFRQKMDCRADCESVHSFTFVPFNLWGVEISHNSAACIATTSAWKTEVSPRAPPPSPITTSPWLAMKA